MKDKFINAGGIRTRYLEEGSGPALILIHGSGPGADAWANWRHTMPAFAERYRVIAYDMVGFGLSDKPDPAGYVYSQQSRVKQLIDLIEALGLKSANVVGNSMGGVVTLGTCIARPDLIDKIVLMGSGGALTELNPNLRAAWGYTPSMENMQRILKLLTHEGFEIDPEIVKYRYELSCKPETLAAFAAIVNWIFDVGPLGYTDEQLTQVKHKALIVHGRVDKVIPPEMGWRLNKLIPNSWFHVIPSCGHWAMIERPEEFNAITNWFLTEA